MSPSQLPLCLLAGGQQGPGDSAVCGGRLLSGFGFGNRYKPVRFRFGFCCISGGSGARFLREVPVPMWPLKNRCGSLDPPALHYIMTSMWHGAWLSKFKIRIVVAKKSCSFVSWLSWIWANNPIAPKKMSNLVFLLETSCEPAQPHAGWHVYISHVPSCVINSCALIANPIHDQFT